MKRHAAGLALAALFAAAAACGGDDDDTGTDPDGGTPFVACDDSDQAFVRATYLALLGRRPGSQAEVNVYADIMAQTRALAGGEGAADAGPSGALDPREVVARAILERDGLVDRWSEHFMDALRIARFEDQSLSSCYGAAHRSSDRGITDGALATYLRDNPATSPGDGLGTFSMRDVLRSALNLDDVSVIYRAHLFPLVSRPIPAANVPPIEAELARREDFGQVFDSAYLNRDLVCLGCHNSESAVTDSTDPALDRHFPLIGHLEKAVYGSSSGLEPARAHAPFRFDGFSASQFGNGGGVHPWGMDLACGEFYPDGLEDDPAGVDGRFASLSGARLTVFELERSLERGVTSLAANGLVVAADGTIEDPDQGFAYLVAMSVVESVWREVIGTPLTIANYFPRNQAASEILKSLTDELVRNHFSLRELLVDIVTTSYFNRLPPEAGCGDGPYGMPNVYDPWTTSDLDEARRQNGPADGIVPLSARTLIRSALEALDWPRPAALEFPLDDTFSNFCVEFYSCEQMIDMCDTDGTCCESVDGFCSGVSARLSPEEIFAFEKGIGVFLKNAERGFRGLDFQARLVWEDVFGACQNIGDGKDFVASLVARALASPAATVGDVVATLKDRLVGQARVDNTAGASGVSEAGAIEAIMGAPLATPVAGLDSLEDRTRALCGVLMSSPQFLMSGMSPPESAYLPILTSEGDSYDAICAGVAEDGLSGGLALTCEAGGLSVTATAGP